MLLTVALTGVQPDVLDYIDACQTSFVSCEGRTPKETLQALLRADSAYGTGSMTNVACFRDGAVSLPTLTSARCMLSDNLDGDAKECLDNFEARCLLSEEELSGSL